MCSGVARCGAHVCLWAVDSWVQKQKQGFLGTHACVDTKMELCAWNSCVCKLVWRCVCATTHGNMLALQPMWKITGVVHRLQSMCIRDVGAAGDRAGCDLGGLGLTTHMCPWGGHTNCSSVVVRVS